MLKPDSGRMLQHTCDAQRLFSHTCRIVTSVTSRLNHSKLGRYGKFLASCRAHSSLAKGESDLIYAAATGTGFEKEINIYIRPPHPQLQWTLMDPQALGFAKPHLCTPACPQQLLRGMPLLPPSRVINGYLSRPVFYLSTNLTHVLKRKALTRRHSSSFSISPPSKLTTALITPGSLLMRDRYL